ncbi:WD repeat-containing protein 90 isoform X4 [Hippopotamus amphibius kiboko]|uniref:WD repeat-containing protein 90 isoform X4 n=1 Tax=Hippopotamus amphibius kiboko TaxID=575201 RepID=UPI0025921007|nr:WD repeat-containing protein 90 isoform X4 [Hippopotamus amphibius kiboko]
MARVWQQPFLNVFRYFKVDEWKRSTKEGDVAAVTDKTLKCTVYRVRGSVSAANYIQLPKTSTQSLGLTGRYLYVLFRPLPAKHFVIHLDVSTEDSQVIRVSFSNIFKEFKSTATWLQFPLICEAGTLKKGVGFLGARWTCLQLDLRDILLIYLNRRYSHLKSVRLCASLLVRSIYTSDLCFDPAVSVAEARRAQLPITPIPREMAFPVPKGESWHDHYVHIRPVRPPPCPGPFQKSACPVSTPRSPVWVAPVAVARSPWRGWRPLTSTWPVTAFTCVRVSRLWSAQPQRVHPHKSLLAESRASKRRLWARIVFDKEPCGPRTGPLSCTLATRSLSSSMLTRGSSVSSLATQTRSLPWRWTGAARCWPQHRHGPPACCASGMSRPGSACPCSGAQSTPSAPSASPTTGSCSVASARTAMGGRWWWCGARPRWGEVERLSSLRRRTVMWTSRHLRSPFLMKPGWRRVGGAVCGCGGCEVGSCAPALWTWGSTTHWSSLTWPSGGSKTATHSMCAAAAATSWRLTTSAWLCGMLAASCPRRPLATPSHRSRASVWAPASPSAVSASPRPLALWAPRMATCASGPRTSPLCSWRQSTRAPSVPSASAPTACACCPPRPQATWASWTCRPGSTACWCAPMPPRCWPLPLSAAGDSWPLCPRTTLSASGTWQPCSRWGVTGGELAWGEGLEGHRLRWGLVGGALGPACVWGLKAQGTWRETGSRACGQLVAPACLCSRGPAPQLYDFESPDEAPCAVAFHPTEPTFFCGFSSGAIRSFSLEVTEVLVEHRCHLGAITGLAASPDGSLLFSSCSRGTLAQCQYRSSAPRCRVLRVAANVVYQEACLGPSTLAVSGDSHLLAFVGPSKYTVTIMDAASLDELLRVDVSSLDLAGSRLDSAVAVCFGPTPLGHLLVSTSSNMVAVLDTTSGRVVRELSSVHPAACSALALSGDGRFLLTAADRAVKVWDYSGQASPGCQVYIGHSEPVRAVAFTPDHQQLLSVGDAIFLWDILAPPERAPQGSVQGSPGASLTREAGPGARQLEDVASGTDGLPRQQVPVPSQASSPGLVICARPPEGRDGAFSKSDESHGPEGLHQASGPSVLVQKEAGKASDGAWGAAGGPWDLGMPPHPRGWPSAGGPGRARAWPPTHRDSSWHFTACYKASPLAKGLSLPPAGHEWLHLKAVMGYNGNGHANLVWRPDTGFFAYTCGCLVVVEDLHSGAQQHWLGHPEEISTLALSHDAQVLASASGRSSTASRCQIRVWGVPGGSCQQLLSYHDTAVQALVFSPDDRLLITLGDYADRTLALWSTATYKLMSSTRLLEPVHGVAFNPWDAGELACVGQGAVTLWLLQPRGGDVSLQVHREPIPKEVGGCELTSLCYGAAPLLYCGSSAGQVCVWDTHAGRCFLAWEADNGEIGVLLCSGARLVSGSNARRLRLWAVGAVPELRRKGSGARSSSVFMERELTLDGAIVSAVFHDSMDMGVVGTTAGTLWYVSWAEGTHTRLISSHRSKVNEVVFSPSESHCATCSDDGSVRVWSLASMDLLIQFQVLSQSCLCLAWSPLSCGRPEQQRVAAGYSDGTLRVFSIPRTAMELKMHPHSAALTAIAFSADGQTLLSGDKDGLVAVSHPRTGMTFRVLSDHRGAPICTIQSTRKEYGDLGAEGMDLWLAASGDQRVSVWASDWLRDHCELVDWLSFPAPALTEAPGCLPPSLAAFCPWDEALLVCAGLGVHREVVFYSLHQKQVVEKIPLPFFAVSMSLSPRAHLVAIGFAEHVLRLVDCVSGAVQDFAGHDDSVQLCRFAPSAQLLFTAAHNEILVWEVTGH